MGSRDHFQPKANSFPSGAMQLLTSGGNMAWTHPGILWGIFPWCHRVMGCSEGSLYLGGCGISTSLMPVSHRGLQEAQVTLAARLGEAEEKIKVLHAGRGARAGAAGHGGPSPNPMAHPPLPLPSAEGHPDGTAGAAV